ncbi:substrate-binding domain-containing protein [Thermomonospora catenispora]|uniref:substrate-binding domain-containing protein n=1 Tax=Thermomonospora catenispora TaxID=2493090 RepID=UPI00111CE2FA|nr:substrate-binding domain-containing protein [Thermomonospora catenispora]TNY35569.1 ABC transporter substrate-binding protein [Thermomonospora catenispora]
MAAPPSRRMAAWRRPRLLLAAAVLIAAAGGAWGVRTLAAPCRGAPLSITVAAQPEIAPALRDIGVRFDAQRHRVQGRCVRVRVRAEESAATAADLARRRVTADAWVPSSSVWFAVARDAGADPDAVPERAGSLAASAVVLTTTRAAWRELEDAGAEPSWRLLRSARIGGLPVTRRAPDPAEHAAGMFAMIALDQKGGLDDRLVRDLRAAAPEKGPPALAELLRAERFARLLIVTSEQAVVAHNRRNEPNPAVVLIPDEGTLMLEYPFTGLTRDPVRLQAVDALGSALRSRAARQTFQRHGFRAPDGTLLDVYASRHDLRREPPRPLRLPTWEEVLDAHASWR